LNEELKKGSELFYRLVEETFALERAGKKLIKLHIGSTGLPVPEPALSYLRNLPDGIQAPYGPGAGLAEFRKIAANREGVLPEQIVVGPGSKFLIFSLLMSLKESISELVIPAPFWPAYILMANTLGIPTRIVPTKFESGWKIPDLELKLGSVVMLCNPLNPTSTTLSKADVESLESQALASSSTLIFDEAYRDLAFEPIDFSSEIRIRSFSKEFNLEGWRLGYAVLPEPLAKKLGSLVHVTTSCVSSLIQNVGIACLENRKSILETHIGIWKTRLGALSGALKQAGFEFIEPQSGMYAFVTHPKITNCEQFCRAALEKGVVVSPGSAFGPYDRFIRISASSEAGTLVQAVGILSTSLS
jgi:aspartate aminotransferase